MNGWDNKHKTVILNKNENLNLEKYSNIKDYFLLGSSKEIQKFKRGSLDEKGIIYIRCKENNAISEDIYKWSDLLNSYDFYFIRTESENSKILGFLLPKNKIINHNKANILYNEIIKSPYINDINYLLNVDLNNGNYILNEINKENLIILKKNDEKNKSQGNNDNIINNNRNEIYNINRTVIVNQPNNRLNGNNDFENNNYYYSNNNFINNNINAIPNNNKNHNRVNSFNRNNYNNANNNNYNNISNNNFNNNCCNNNIYYDNNNNNSNCNYNNSNNNYNNNNNNNNNINCNYNNGNISNNNNNNYNNNNNINYNYNNSNNINNNNNNYNNNNNINYNYNNNNYSNNNYSINNNKNYNCINNYIWNQNQYNMNNNNNKMNLNFLNGKTSLPNNNNNKMFLNYGFNSQNNNNNFFRVNRNNNGNSINFQNGKNNNSNINNNINYNNQFGNFNNNCGNNYQNNFQNNNNMIQSQGNIQTNNNFNFNFKEMLSQFLVCLLCKNSINNRIYFEIQNLKNSNYLFYKKGLNNIGSTCFMNATLQCLLHVNELISYFINIYPKDSNNLSNINKFADSKGQISKAFSNVIKGMSSSVNKNYNRFSMFNSPTSYNSFSPDEFKKIIGKYNKQFERFEANDSKDLILYLFQSMHEELNYLGNNSSLPIIKRPNQCDENETFTYFFSTYNMRNFSIISETFYGTYKNITRCKVCNSIIYNFQKFEFLSFGMYDYQERIFTLYNGLDDNEKQQQLKGENQFYCNKCKKLCDAEVTTKIVEAPDKLLINIDYGKNKRFQPSAVIINEDLDLTKNVVGQQGNLKYKLIGVCKHLGYSGRSGHYIAYCKDKKSNTWYKFNDSLVTTIKNSNEISQGNPYLLLYEKIK